MHTTDIDSAREASDAPYINTCSDASYYCQECQSHKDYDEMFHVHEWEENGCCNDCATDCDICEEWGGVSNVR